MAHKLLLADDSVTIQRVIELTFADEDVQLTAVGDGKLAIERIIADPPDIVLADVGMPEKDGYEVAAFIKNNPLYAHIPVLLLTGAFEPVDEERAREAGCDGVLAKPFEPQMVITRVRELLAEASRPVPGRRPVAPPEPQPLPELNETFSSEASTQVMTGATLAPRAADGTGVVPPADEPFTMESALDASVRIRRRQTMTVPEFGVPPMAFPAEPVPAEPSESDASEDPTPVPLSPLALDDYFDQLGPAFSERPGPDAGTAALPLDLSWAPAALQDPELTHTAFDRVLDDLPLQSGLADVPDAVPEPVPAPEAEAAPPAFARAFSALLAAESGDADAGSVAFFGAPAAPAIDVDDLVARTTRQVLEQMTDRVVRDTVTDIVSRIAERLVREEIDRIKASIK